MTLEYSHSCSDGEIEISDDKLVNPELSDGGGIEISDG